MIKNEKQYKITKKKLLSLTEKIAELSSRENPSLTDQLLLAASINFKQNLEEEIVTYERLKTGQTDVLKERDIADLPSLITEYKIASGLTQKEFSQKLGIKEQQLQRYEADNFKSITFKNLLKIFRTIGLNVTIKV